MAVMNCPHGFEAVRLYESYLTNFTINARDETHITQLLGRMVRTPLTRRVPGNDLLNSVACVLPHFDRTTAAKVARNMLGEREHDEDGTGEAMVGACFSLP